MLAGRRRAGSEAWRPAPNVWPRPAAPRKRCGRRLPLNSPAHVLPALLLAVLPGVGVLLGTGLGASPSTSLLRTPWGFACLVLGALLAIAGVAWTERLARTAEEAG